MYNFICFCHQAFYLANFDKRRIKISHLQEVEFKIRLFLDQRAAILNEYRFLYKELR